MLTLMLLLTLGCAKQNKLLSSAKYAFRDNNCVETLRAYVRSAGCPELVVHERPPEVIIRCLKPDEERGKFYDNYWFRLTPAKLQTDIMQLPIIEKHTICIDQDVRIEAYPPD